MQELYNMSLITLNGILYTSRLADKRAFGYSEEIEKFWKKNDEEKSIIITC